MFAWNATSKPPPGDAAMAGLVPAFIPCSVFLLPALPYTIRFPVFAWNASS